MKKNRIITTVVIVVGIVLFGFFVPLGSYTSQYGCNVSPLPTKRLHLILGQTLEDQREEDMGAKLRFDIGCALNTKFTQYLF